MNELGRRTIIRALSEWYNPAAAFRDCKGFFLDEVCSTLGLKETATREQYFEMTTKCDLTFSPVKYMTEEQQLWCRKILVMLENIASSYEKNVPIEHLEELLQEQDRGAGIAEILIPWARELYTHTRERKRLKSTRTR